MKLSVIVPVYNTAGEGKLEYCLDSLVKQTYKDMEIIAVDDCSTDHSLEILRRYERQYPERFRAVHSPETGSRAVQRIWDCPWQRESGLVLLTATTG